MKKGLLISPPIRNQRKMNLIPGGLLSIGGYLRKQGYEIKVYDSGFPYQTSYPDKIEKTIKTVEKYSPDFIGIGFPTEAFDSAVEIARIIKESDKNIVVIVGGIHPTAKPVETLSVPFFDFLVHGEGEITTKELLDGLNTEKDLAEVKGISYKVNGKVITNDSRPEMLNLDDIPFDHRDLLLGVEEYPKEALGQVLTSRGCSYNCAYCSSSIIWEKKVRFRSPTNVLKEIDYLNSQYKVKDINFADDNLLSDPKRVKVICDEILNRRLKINWRCCARADIHLYFNGDLLKLMHKAGCRQICIGFESGSQKLLDAVNRGINLANIKQTIKMMNDAHIKLHADFIIGLPGENLATLNETFDLMKLVWEWCCPTMTVVLFKPYPGTQTDGAKRLIDYQGLKNELKRIFDYAEMHNVRHLATEPGYIWDSFRKNISSLKNFGSVISKFLKAWF